MNKEVIKKEYPNERVLENCLMMHRYLYYVLGKPVISDKQYDDMEKTFLYLYPDNKNINKVGSDRGNDYSDDVKKLAESLI